MSRKSIYRAGPEIVKQESISFNKTESGYYQKVIKTTYKDLKTGTIIKEEEKESDSFYKITAEDDFDHEMKYEDPDGNDASIRFKGLTEDEMETIRS